MKTTLAHLTAKSAFLILRLFGRRGTQVTGAIALKMDRDFLKNIKKPGHIISVTGTNGKTTTSNLIGDVLEQRGHSFVHNRNGSNTIRGIASAFANQMNVFASSPSYAVLEQDELWLRRLMPFYVPNTLTVTNLFQDSIDRNASIGFIFSRINEAIRPSMKLILNATDSISAYLGTDQNERIYFSVLPLPGEQPSSLAKIQDQIYCPRCDHKLNWSFQRYHHIGFYHCPHCGFTNPNATYEAYDRDPAKGTLSIHDHGREVQLPLIDGAVENIYNEMAAWATLRENGFSVDDLLVPFSKLRITASRLDRITIGSKQVTSIVAKGNNPVANSRIFSNIEKEKGPCTVVYLTDDAGEAQSHKCAGWIYMTDFAHLRYVDQILFCSKNAGAAQFTAILDGVDSSRIHVLQHMTDVLEYIEPHKKESIYILHDIEDYSQQRAADLMEKLREKEESHA